MRAVRSITVVETRSEWQPEENLFLRGFVNILLDERNAEGLVDVDTVTWCSVREDNVRKRTIAVTKEAPWEKWAFAQLTW